MLLAPLSSHIRVVRKLEKTPVLSRELLHLPLHILSYKGDDTPPSVLGIFREMAKLRSNAGYRTRQLGISRNHQTKALALGRHRQEIAVHQQLLGKVIAAQHHLHAKAALLLSNQAAEHIHTCAAI